MNRRQFLQGIGAFSVLVAGGGVYRAVNQGVFSSGTGPAFEAWADWQSSSEKGPVRMIQAGILASNPHNTQPWLFEVKGNTIDLFADTSRHLGSMDPYLREMHIGLGCAIENMMLTAAADGHKVDLTLANGVLSPPAANPQMSKVASFTLSPAAKVQSPLYDAIPNRHTNRFNYDANRTISAKVMSDLLALAQDESDIKIFLYQKGTNDYQTFAQATVTSTETIISDHTMAHDSFAWVDQNWQEMQADKDGPYIDTSGSSPALRTLVKMLPPTSQEQFDAGWLSNTKEHMETTAVLGFIAVPDLYDRAMAMQAGQMWQRVHLWATSQNLAMQPINQMPEVVDRDRQLGRESAVAGVMDLLTGEPQWRPTFAFRMGHPINETLPSARRPVEEVLI